MSGLFRDLYPDEVECRVGQVSKTGNGLSLLLYKTARTDMALLDETVGPMDWQCRYEEVNDVLNCTLSVFDNRRGEWVNKQAAGTESNMEPEKGESSDALKRAGFLWGIGRELYTAPFIWVKAQDCNLTKNNKGVYQCYDTFAVDSMEVQNGRITSLSISNKKTHKVVFRWSLGGSKAKSVKTEKPQPAAQAEIDELQAECNEFAFLKGKEVADVLDALEKTNSVQAAGFTQWKDAPSAVIVAATKVVKSWNAKVKAQNATKAMNVDQGFKQSDSNGGY